MSEAPTLVGLRGSSTVAHLAQSGLGQSTTLEVLCAAYLPSAEAYRALHQRLAAKHVRPADPGQPRPLQEIEAYRAWRELQPQQTGCVREYMTPDFYFEPEMATEEEQVAADVEAMQQYKLTCQDYYQASLLLPRAGYTTPSVYISHGQEFQVLAMFQSRSWACEVLVKYLDSQSAPRTYAATGSERFLRRTWDLLTGGAPVSEHLAAYQGAVKAQQSYAPPLLPWLARLLDFQFIFRSRVPGQAPSLLRELMATQRLLQLLLQPSSFGSVTELCKVLQHFEDCHASAQDSSPWSELLELVHSSSSSTDVDCILEPLDALAHCIQELRVWLPNSWLQLTGITMVDTAGYDDSDQAQLRHIQAHANTSIVLLDRDTDAAVFNALKDSTFMERWITGQLGSVARPPTLALMLNMERYGLPPPAKQREIRGCSIDVKYIMKFPGHVAGKAAAREAALRQQLSMVIERYLREKQLTPEATSQAAHQDTQRRTQQLTRAVPIFCGLPLLGLTLLRHQERLLQEYTAEQWTAAVAATRVYEWAAAQLLQPASAIVSSRLVPREVIVGLASELGSDLITPLGGAPDALQLLFCEGLKIATAEAALAAKSAAVVEQQQDAAGPSTAVPKRHLAADDDDDSAEASKRHCGS